MKVAIIGAGVAGLSCAYEFEKHGIMPTIIEIRRRIGEDVDFNACTLRLFDRMYEDPLKYIKDNYNMDLKPLNSLNEIVMHSPNKETVVKSTGGYIFRRGEAENSLENQLAAYVKTSITFYKYIYIDDIKNEYNFIINATGKLDYSKQLGLLTPQLNAYSRMSVISGSYKTNAVEMWVNTEYAKNCFCYLLPHSPNKASLVLSVNDVSHQELDYYWEKFMVKENIRSAIVKTSDVLHDAGAVFPHKSGNIYFVGKAGGFAGSVLGFGMIDAIETGALAARSIINNIDYEELIKPNFDHFQKKYEFRKILDTYQNEDFDKLIELLGRPGIKQLIYNNPVAKVTQGTFLAKLFNRSHNQ